MTVSLISTLCVLFLLSYLFDISSRKTRIPSVILLLALGWTVRRLTVFMGISIPDLTPLLPPIGTLGLILIVLEGSMLLNLTRSRLPYAGKSFLVALFPIIILSFGLAYVFQHYLNVSFMVGLSNAIPFSVISSAIAIPSVMNLGTKNRDFIIYESSLSDVFGVIFFNYIILNDYLSARSAGFFFVELAIVLLVTLISTALLVYLLSKINHHVKFVPLIIIIVLTYDILKIYHLPALVFILLFGLLLGNLDGLSEIKLFKSFQPGLLKKEVHGMQELTSEFAFLIRALFFLLFGYLLEATEIMDTSAFKWSIGISAAIFIIRFAFLKLMRLPVRPLLFIAPRGLITILLFLSIPADRSIELVNRSVIIQVILITALLMMFGLMFRRTSFEEQTVEEE